MSDRPATDHDRNLSAAFDGQAARFEKAPVQTDPAALARLVRFSDLLASASILDAGCGPGLVSEAFADAGHRVTGVDLSPEMIARARSRCGRFGDRTRFECQSLYDSVADGPFDAAVSRYVLHHVAEPLRFIDRQKTLVHPGGLVIVSDHTTDPDVTAADWHRDLEIARDRTHTTNFAPGALVDLLALAGLGEIRMFEEPFTLDFDEWFDRGTPSLPKAEVRERLLSGQSARGFRPVAEPSGSITLHCWRVVARGVVPS